MQLCNRLLALGNHWRSQRSHLLRTLQLLWQASGRLTLLWIGLSVLQGLLPPLALYLVRTLVDQLVVAIGAAGAWQELRPALFTALAVAVLIVLGELLRSLSEWVNVAQSEYITDHVRALIQQKATQIDLAFFEQPDYHDRLARVRDQASTRPLSLLHNTGGLLRDGIALLGVGVVLLSYSLWLPVALFLSALPAFAAVIHFNRRHHNWWLQKTPERRKADYFDSLLTEGHVAAELRLFALGDYFRAAYQWNRQQLRGELLRLSRQQALARLAAQLVVIIGFVLLMGWMSWRALRGLGTLGDVALLFQAFNQTQSMVSSLLRNLANIYRDVLYLSELFEFLALSPQIIEPVQPQPAPVGRPHSLRFESVTFRYPGSQRIVLDDLSLVIPGGKIVAIVGENGSGKSTLVKLLCRFYDPDAGQITLDGVDLRCLALAELRRQYTVLFQQPAHYSATVAENIRYADLQAEPGAHQLEAVARSAGAHGFIDQLPAQYETLLGRTFAEGFELSGGEWQRLALARAFWRPASLMILDEPTSALDSWSETDWFTRLRAVATGKTVLLITHRLALAKNADLIYVMDKGRIVEAGDHEALLLRDGRYAASWAAQLRQVTNSHCHQPPAIEPVEQAIARNGHGAG